MQDSHITSYPTDWPQRVLGDLCEIQIGGTPSRNVPRFWAEAGEGYPWVAISDLGPKWVHQTAEHITAAGVANSNVKPIPKGTILMSFKLTLGRVGIAGTDLYTNEAIAAFYPAANLDAIWLYHALPSISKGGTAEQAIKGQTLNKDKLQCLLLRVPPLPEQRGIAEILDTVDAAIQQTEALIAKLKLMKAGLLHDLLTRGLDEHGQLRDPSTHPEQFKDSPLGRIPREWERAPLAAMKPQERPYIKTGPFGSSLKGEHWVEEGVPVITIGSLGEGQFIKSDLLYISESKARSLATYAVMPGDLVFSRVADVGRSVVVSEAEDGWIMSSNLMRISLNHSQAIPAFAHLNLVYNERTRQQVRRFVNAGGREVANTAILNSLEFTWPSLVEQARIAKIAATYDARIRAEEAHCDKLKQLKKGLMRDLLTGRVRVQEEADA